jgi:serine/threonine protein kinase
MVIETLSAELERLFSLEELTELSQNGLGFDPQEVGGATAKGSFARALAQRCVAHDAVEALFDVIRAQRKEPSEQAVSLLNGGLALEPPLASGDQIGEYFLVRELGKGPSARCFHGSNSGADVRVKVLHSTVRRRDAQRYLAASRLSTQAFHGSLPNALQAGALDAQSGFLGVTQEYVAGESLATLHEREGARHFNAILPLLWAIAEPLGALHSAGIAHGALHMNNIIVVDPTPAAPKVLLVDVGANLLRPGVSTPASKRAPRWLAGIAPEQLRDGKTDLRSDLYAFGALIYELTSGRAPFSGSPLEVVMNHLRGTPEAL